MTFYIFIPQRINIVLKVNTRPCVFKNTNI